MHLHIICSEVPDPVCWNGGGFELFYKIKTLYGLGVNIHLHCYAENNQYNAELSKYCKELIFYEQLSGHKGFSTTLPYAVASRRCKVLLANLLKDNYPIMMEGLACTHHVMSEKLKDRVMFVNITNIESDYYQYLSKHANSLLKKTYYQYESHLLQRFEKEIATRIPLFTTSQQAVRNYLYKLGAKEVDYYPAFSPYHNVTSHIGLGSYFLFYANLEVSANAEAAKWLLNKVFHKIDIPFVIAGKNPSEDLEHLAHEYPNTCMVANPAEREMQDMIAKAQGNILLSYNDTIAIPNILNALYHGRHCIVNEASVINTGLENICHIANDPFELQEVVTALYNKKFTQDDIDMRSRVLSHDPQSNTYSGQDLIRRIYA